MPWFCDLDPQPMFNLIASSTGCQTECLNPQNKRRKRTAGKYAAFTFFCTALSDIFLALTSGMHAPKVFCFLVQGHWIKSRINHIKYWTGTWIHYVLLSSLPPGGNIWPSSYIRCYDMLSEIRIFKSECSIFYFFFVL